ncbi:hypothetical protein F2Q68_00038357 [Brassica cretica]|uniref:Uncharacterized protein n=2 Tax=Brassica cretica TaxID=69181 RepID=A0ABQ7BQA9_BRACR|nr:hypothetical protein F2Q68_00038357 [Brassica cretica]KAF3534306.1 hypothetical protein DY000_02041469 [Brassica cretica]KAF3606554.1 hypothetical protein DY000_02044532 [Brassica cretica]
MVDESRRWFSSSIHLIGGSRRRFFSPVAPLRRLFSSLAPLDESRWLSSKNDGGYR